MDKNRLITNHLLQNNEPVTNTNNIDKMSLLSNPDQIEPLSFVKLIEVKDLCADISDANRSNGFIEEIGLNPKWLHDSLRSLLFQIEQNPSLAAYTVVEIIEKNILGDEDTFVRIIDTLQRHEKYFEAYALSRYAAKNLCGRSLNIYTRCLEICPFVPGNKPREFAFSIIRDFSNNNAMKSWMNERTYIAVCNFYFKTIATSVWEEKATLLAEGISWARELIEYERANESGYFWEVTFLLQGNRRKEAENRLRLYIYDPPEPRRDFLTRLRCPRCCELYYELFLRYKGSYNQRKEILIKGYEDSRALNLKEKIPYFEDELQNLNNSQGLISKLII